MNDAVFPPLVEIPAEAVDPMLGPEINPNNETVVDIRAGTDAAVILSAWVNPGRFVGDKLVVRMVRRIGDVSGGVDQENKATIRLKVVDPTTRMRYIPYIGFDDTNQFDFPAFPGSPYPGKPQFAIFRWTGSRWLPILTDLA